MSENTRLKKIQLAVSPFGTRLFRNQVGEGWIGKSTVLANGDVLIKNPRRIRFGLPVGSSDLIGWTPRDGVAVFTAIEDKDGLTRITEDQHRWVDAIVKIGGIAGIVRSPEDAEKLISRG